MSVARDKGVKVRDMLTVRCVLAQHPDWWARVKTNMGGTYWLCAEHAVTTPFAFTHPVRLKHPPFVAQCEDCRSFRNWSGLHAFQQFGRTHRSSSKSLNINNLPRDPGKARGVLGVDLASAPSITVVELKPF